MSIKYCEPCGYKGDETPATGSRGMDGSPVCDWHLRKSWSHSVEELQRIFAFPNSVITKYRFEELVKIGAEAIKEKEKHHRDNDLNPLLGYADRAEVAARLVIERLIARDEIR